MSLAYLFAAVEPPSSNGEEGRGHQDSDRDNKLSVSGSPPESDSALLARLRSGDKLAFDELVSAHSKQLIAFAITLLGAREPAEDIVQDMLLWIWQRREIFTLSGSLRTYLLTAVRRRAINIIKRSNREQLYVARSAAEASPINDLFDDSSEEDARLWQAVQQLPSHWREAVTLRYVARLEYAEVGRVLGVSAEAARKLVRRAIDDLRRILA